MATWLSYKIARHFYLQPKLQTIDQCNTVVILLCRKYQSWRYCVFSKKKFIPAMTYQQYAYFASKKATRKKNSNNTKKDSNVSAISQTQCSSLTQELKTKIKSKKYSYVFEQSVAEHVVATVLKHRANPSAPLLEIGAGAGLISKELLKQGVSKVVALELNPDLVTLLKDVQREVGADRFTYFNWQMTNLYLKFHTLQQSDSMKTYQKMESRVAELLLSASSAHRDGVPYSLFCIGGKEENYNTMVFIVQSLLNEDVILSQNVEFFMFVHPRFKMKCDYLSSISKSNDSAHPLSIKDRGHLVHFNYMHTMLLLFYDIDIIGELNTNDFYPLFSSAVAVQDRGLDCSKRLLIKMQRKRNFNQILPLEHQAPFLQYLQQIYKKKLIRTIPAMEMLIPGCGLRMIAEGFTMMDKIITTPPEDFLKLYKLILAWPEFRSSPLYSHIMMKLTGTNVEIGPEEADESCRDGR